MNNVIKYKNNGKLLTRERAYTVYALIDPLTKEIMYIGHTSDSYNRIRYHVKYGGKSSGGPKLKKYLSELKTRDLQVFYKELKKFKNNELAKSMERALIKKIQPPCNILCK